MYIGVHVKYRILSDLNELEFYSQIFSKNARITNVIKILPLGTGFFRADGQAEGKDRYT
jgi:hypothetical protein